jgi:predicted nucleic acid-binding protein
MPRRRVYWDANVWQSYVNGEADRLAVIDDLLSESAKDDGTVRLFTSEVSKVEVAFATYEQQAGNLDPKAEEAIDAMWADRSALDVVEYHARLSIESRSLIRLAVSKGWSLKPLDAIHLATAKWLRVDEFHTYDDRLFKFATDVGLKILIPYVEKPRLL